MALYQVITKITIQQVTDFTPQGGQPIKRNKKFQIDFLHSYSGQSSWESLAQTMKIELPKNVKFREIVNDQPSPNLYSLASINGQPSSIGGYVGIDVPPDPSTLIPPTFMKGDLITFDIGYRAKLFAKDGSEVTYMTGGPDPTGVYPTSDNLVSTQQGIPHLFDGFISRVSPTHTKKRKGGVTTRGHRNNSFFTLECEDAMFLLSYIPTTNKQWNNSNLPKIFNSLINAAYADTDNLLNVYKKLGISISLSTFSETDLVFNVSNFITQRGDVRSMLNRMKHQYKINSWFRGNELRLGMTNYVPGDAVTQNFTFQQNILDNDKLSFKRKDDTPLSVIVTAYYGVKTGHQTKPIPPATEGKDIIKNEQTQILVYNQAGQFQKVLAKKGVDFPSNDVGSRFTLKRYTPETDVNVLFQWGVRFLKQFYYDGLEGSFTTFGIPYVKHGDVVNLVNPVLPEMNGLYMVKAVNAYGGAEGGLRQDITLDYKINTYADITSFIS